MKLSIKDLDTSKELARGELAAVRGGSNFAMVVGPTQAAQNGGGFNFGSPVTQVAPQTVTQQDTAVNMATVFGSANTAIGQIRF